MSLHLLCVQLAALIDSKFIVPRHRQHTSSAARTALAVRQSSDYCARASHRERTHSEPLDSDEAEDASSRSDEATVERSGESPPQQQTQHSPPGGEAAAGEQSAQQAEVAALNLVESVRVWTDFLQVRV